MRKKTAYRPSEPHRRYVTRRDGSRVINDAYVGPSRQPGGRTSSNFADIIGTHDVDREIERLYGDDAIPYEVNVPASVENVLGDLYDIGNPLITGGSVRDSIAGIDSKDIDIEVHGTDIDSLTSHLVSRGYHVDEVGKQFGVLKARKGRVTDLDISVPRRENRTGAGHRSFDVVIDSDMTLREAVERRDFTFNALMYDHRRKVMIDTAGGKDDFEEGLMRHVSDKFAEDPLRVLRGFQFAARFGMSYDPETAEFARGLRGEYDTLPAERVQDEWNKFFTKGRYFPEGFSALRASGWDDTQPGLRAVAADPVTGDDLQRLGELPPGERTVQGAAYLAYRIDEQCTDGNMSDGSRLIGNIVAGKKNQRAARDLAALTLDDVDSDENIRKTALRLSKAGVTMADASKAFLVRGSVDGVAGAQRAEELGVSAGPEPDWITGDDVLSATDRKPGRWVSEVLNDMRDKQYSRRVSSRDEALAELKRSV